MLNTQGCYIFPLLWTSFFANFLSSPPNLESRILAAGLVFQDSAVLLQEDAE
jgi:hypothetical protein